MRVRIPVLSVVLLLIPVFTVAQGATPAASGTGSEPCQSHARATGLEAGGTRGGVGRRLW